MNMIHTKDATFEFDSEFHREIIINGLGKDSCAIFVDDILMFIQEAMMKDQDVSEKIQEIVALQKAKLDAEKTHVKEKRSYFSPLLSEPE